MKRTNKTNKTNNTPKAMEKITNAIIKRNANRIAKKCNRLLKKGVKVDFCTSVIDAEEVKYSLLKKFKNIKCRVINKHFIKVAF